MAARLLPLLLPPLLLLLLLPDCLTAKPAKKESGGTSPRFVPYKFRGNFPLPSAQMKIKGAAGVAIKEADNRSVVFHRNGRDWDSRTFDAKNRYTKRAQGPIRVNPIVEINDKGETVAEYGKDVYYMPHSVSTDKLGRLWTTDVARHQMIRLDAKGKPDLVLGVAFEPGRDKAHFCMPTDVAVADNGEFFVSDGYCNSRVVKFDKDGKFLAEFGSATTDPDSLIPNDELLIPHGLALRESDDLLCIADRENRRVVCIRAGLKNPAEFGQLATVVHLRGRPYDVAFLANGNLLSLVTEDSDANPPGTEWPLETSILVELRMNVGVDYVLEFNRQSQNRLLRGFGKGHSLAVHRDGLFLLVGSLDGMCEADKAEAVPDFDGFDIVVDCPRNARHEMFRYDIPRPQWRLGRQ